MKVSNKEVILEMMSLLIHELNTSIFSSVQRTYYFFPFSKDEVANRCTLLDLPLKLVDIRIDCPVFNRTMKHDAMDTEISPLQKKTAL